MNFEKHKHSARRGNESGYALLMVVFIVATMIIASAAIVPSVLTQGRREKEAEMVWRGEQYERAIGLYYRKFGKYPTKVEDLTRDTNGVRFLRKAYPDPMNKEDGSWRFIYVGPNGQLIGSLKQSSLLQTTLNSTGMGGLSAFGAASPLGGGASQGFALPGSAAANAQQQQPGVGAPGQQTNSASAANPLESQPQPLEGSIVGGNIIGVGSKIKKPSLRVYLGGDTYQMWEFIWNPTGQTAVPGAAPANPNANPTGAPGGATPNVVTPNNTNPPPAGTIIAPDGSQQPQQSPQVPVINGSPGQ